MWLWEVQGATKFADDCFNTEKSRIVSERAPPFQASGTPGCSGAVSSRTKRTTQEGPSDHPQRKEFKNEKRNNSHSLNCFAKGFPF